MSVEIERKFLVNDNTIIQHKDGEEIIQGYLSRTAKRVVRIRMRGSKGYITVKGEKVGLTCPEYEYEIPLTDALDMLGLCVKPWLHKTRYVINDGIHTWDVDVFHGKNEGLIVAELELKSETDPVALPSWVGADVTNDKRYANTYLSNHRVV
jgi:CYTH domain-containing protein